MISRGIQRFIHTNCVVLKATKSPLAKLRKKTGYTFSNCKKALELHGNDLEKAEKWLADQAQALGWSKAEKLQGRTTAQGLVAVMVDKNHGALVEVNCETDFVARNVQFQDLVKTIVKATMKVATEVPVNKTINRSLLDAETLKALPALDGKSLADHIALIIGNVGENIGLRRALCVTVHPDIKLAGCTHPGSPNRMLPAFGKYGAILAYKSGREDNAMIFGLCQHIIGMNPLKIGSPEEDKPAENADDETSMIYQDYLVDPNLTVQQVLEESQTEILDIARFEMGENIEETQPLNSAEASG